MGQILTVFFLAILLACSEPSTRRIGSAPLKSSTPTDAPDFQTPYSFFLDDNRKVIGTLRLDMNNINNYELSGIQVNNYIGKVSGTKNMCIIARFPTSPENKILLVSGAPLYNNDFKKNLQGWYYLLRPWEKEINQAGCENSKMLDALNVKYPGESVVFSLKELCVNCIENQMFSQTLELLYPDGSLNNLILINNLKFLVSYKMEITAKFGAKCLQNIECISVGFSCCSSGRCIKDGTLKEGTDLKSQEYLQSLKDTLMDPAKYLNYPAFYNICEIMPPEATASSTEASTSTFYEEIANLQYQEKRDLYLCTVPQYKEMSYCTIDYKNLYKEDPNYLYSTLGDDRNFTSSYSGAKGLSPLSITKVQSNGVTLFENGVFLKENSVEFGPPNDNLTDSTYIKLNYPPKESDRISSVKVSYQIDGSCEKINDTQAKCFIIYTQGKNEGKIDDHFPASNFFQLPFYADLTRTMKVQVNGIDKLNTVQWQLIKTIPANIEFMGDDLMVKDTEEVKITYFVNTQIHPVLQAKQKALDTINKLCRCGPYPCLLKPVIRSDDSIYPENHVDYICDFITVSSNNLISPINLDSKTVPQLYYDINGVYHSRTDASTPPQEGKEFKYIKDNYLRPNNQDQYIGFNEINGSFNTLTNSAKPASMVPVEVGKTYDIFVNQGIFSSCNECGNDYFNKVLKLFPKSLNSVGGGYTPDNITSNPFKSPIYRSDDLLFGRSCFIPATMIPYTHRNNYGTQTQRLNRQAAQHFLFANGYQRDWYGFDYGSVIGSFDGISWFSVGNQRRIKATSNRLFLAVNSYFGDLTQTNTFSIHISNATNVAGAGSAVNYDILSDGAQCQQNHICDSDKDCLAQLGYDYFCEPVANIYTNWPVIDINGMEVPNSNQSVRFLNLVGGRLLFGEKRCVYRGKGAPCIPNYTTLAATETYDNTDRLGLHACSTNNYCERFEKGVPVALFNNRIARYGRSPTAQNNSEFVINKEENTFGLQAKIIGRPYNFNASEEIISQAKANLNYNHVPGICIPGRTPETKYTTFVNQHQTKPANDNFGDVVNNIGMTPSGDTPQPNYLSSCAILDETGNYYQLWDQNAVKTLGNDDIKRLAGSQAYSTNLLNLIETLADYSILRDFISQPVTSPFLQNNRCLRAVGSPCFSDFECAPSKYIAQAAAGIDYDDYSAYSSYLNKYEIQFWQEELICGQGEVADAANTNYLLKNNRCCRSVGKNMTSAFLLDQNGLPFDPSYPVYDNRGIAGLDIDINSSLRYSKNSTVYSLQTTELLPNYPYLGASGNNKCSTGLCGKLNDLKYQFNTLQVMNGKTCCTKHWIRNFNSQSNGGGHIWTNTKQQNINKTSFTCINWRKCTPGKDCNTPQFSCSETEDPDDPQCLARSLSDFEAKPYFDWLGTLELTGVPQIAIKSNESQDIRCSVNPQDQSEIGTSTLPNIIAEIDSTNGVYSNTGAVTEEKYFNSLDSDVLLGGSKIVFSPDTYTCCLPLGSTTKNSEDPNICCSGLIKDNRCALNDYTDLTVYFNLYISSEASDLSPNLIDPSTGYITNIGTVEELACQKRACASNKIARGIALANLKIPGHEEKQTNVKRFVDNDTATSKANAEVASLYNAGLRWNTHVYCAPEKLVSNVTVGLTVIDCSSYGQATQQ